MRREKKTSIVKDPLLGQALQNSWDRPALGTGHSKFLGQARSWDRPFNILGTSLLSGQALQNSWDKPALGTGPSKFLGQARSWDMPFNFFGGCHFLQTVLANSSPPPPPPPPPRNPSPMGLLIRVAPYKYPDKVGIHLGPSATYNFDRIPRSCDARPQMQRKEASSFSCQI